MSRKDLDRRSRLAGLCLLAALAFASFALGTTALAEDKPAEGEMPGMTEEQMQAMMALIQPGPMHARLAQAAGTWKTTNKMWEGPGEPLVGEGSVTFEVVLGGRYVIGRHTGNYRGMPFEGMSVDGYDKAKKQYVSLWIDNFGTGFMSLTGQPAKDGNGIDLTGSMVDPASGSDLQVREELRHEGDNKFVMTMYMQPPGGGPEMKVMEYTGVRQ